ncbi:MAG: polysaccharide deacetylase family protein [Pseudomonadales bacterium]
MVLLYHHVAEDTPAATTISPRLFKRHLDYLSEHGYQVLALSDIVARLQQGEPLPAQTVAITFDDAYRSLLEVAVPELNQRQWPYTVFVNTQAVATRAGPYLTWSELRTLRDQGASIQNHSHSHDHLAFPAPEESRSAWIKRVREDIALAQQQLTTQLEIEPTLFAWPYGEYTPELDAVVQQLDLVGFAQQSGAISVDALSSGQAALPRTPFNEQNGGMDRFIERLKMLPLPVQSDPPTGLRLSASEDRPAVKIDISAPPARIDELACYANGVALNISEVTHRGQSYSATLVPSQAFKPGRTKINCTVPAEHGRWYWWSHLSMLPYPDGSWYTF